MAAMLAADVSTGGQGSVTGPIGKRPLPRQYLSILAGRRRLFMLVATPPIICPSSQ